MTDTDSYAILHALEVLDEAGVGSAPTLAERIRVLASDRDKLEEALTARARQTNLEKLLEALDEDRSVLLLAIRDAYLEEGRDEEAAGWGWLGSRKKWPSRVKNGRWRWWRTNRTDEESDMLPEGLLDSATISEGFWPSCRAALEAVVQAIARGNWRST